LKNELRVDDMDKPEGALKRFFAKHGKGFASLESSVAEQEFLELGVDRKRAKQYGVIIGTGYLVKMMDTYTFLR
jgi:hypothetical protein